MVMMVLNIWIYGFPTAQAGAISRFENTSIANRHNTFASVAFEVTLANASSVRSRRKACNDLGHPGFLHLIAQSLAVSHLAQNAGPLSEPGCLP
jgi:hypothetical protein